MIVNNVAIEIEGMDKTGKDMLAGYISLLSNYAYTINVRGILTQMVYSDKFNRNYEYILPYKPFVVFLDVDNVDHAVRCSLSHEPKININKDREAYYTYIEELRKHDITVLCYDTTKMTPYNIAQDVVKHLSKTNIDDFICTEPIHFNSLNVYDRADLNGEDIFYEFKIEEEN